MLGVCPESAAARKGWRTAAAHVFRRPVRLEADGRSLVPARVAVAHPSNGGEESMVSKTGMLSLVKALEPLPLRGGVQRRHPRDPAPGAPRRRRQRHFAMLLADGARGDIGSARGITAIDLLSRKKDPAFRRMAEQLATLSAR